MNAWHFVFLLTVTLLQQDSASHACSGSAVKQSSNVTSPPAGHRGAVIDGNIDIVPTPSRPKDCGACDLYQFNASITDSVSPGAAEPERWPISVIKIIVDLHVPGKGIFSGGPCPGSWSQHGPAMHPDYTNSNEEVPLIWALTSGEFGRMYVLMPIGPVSLYSTMTLERNVKTTEKHLQVLQQRPCNVTCKPRKHERINAMAKLILRFAKSMGYSMLDKKLALWWRKPAPPRSADIFYLIPARELGVIDYKGCAEFISGTDNASIDNFICKPEPGVESRYPTYAYMDYSWPYHVGIGVFNIVMFVTVLFVAPLPPLKILSVLLANLSRLIQRNHRRLCESPAAKAEERVSAQGNQRAPVTPAQYRMQWSEHCQIFSSYRLAGVMPQSLLSSQVWPFLRVILSQHTANAFLFMGFLVAYIIWPVVHYFYLMRKAVRPADLTGEGCEWYPIPSTNNTHFHNAHYPYTLGLAASMLLLPPMFVLGHTCGELYLQRKAVFISTMQEVRRRKELRCMTCWKLVEGKLKPKPCSAATWLLQNFVLQVASIFSSSYEWAVTTTRSALDRVQLAAGSVCGALIIVWLVPCIGVVALLQFGAQIVSVLAVLAYKESLLVLQSVPLLRLSTIIAYGSVWPLFDLEGSLMALLLSLAAVYPMGYVLTALFVDVFLYAFFTSLGLVSNYGIECIFFVSMLSTIVLRLRRQYHNFYEPFQSLQREIVNYHQKAEIERLEEIFGGLASPSTCSGFSTDSAHSLPRTGVSRPTVEGQEHNTTSDTDCLHTEVMRIVAAQTFLALSYSCVSQDSADISSVLEDLPWSWCHTLLSKVHRTTDRISSMALPARKQHRRRMKLQSLPCPTVRITRASRPSASPRSLYEVAPADQPPASTASLGRDWHPARELLLAEVEGGDQSTQRNSFYHNYRYMYNSGQSAPSSPALENSQISPSSLIGLACQCITWREMEDVLKKHIREKTITSVAYAIFQALFFTCVFCFMIEFGSLFKSHMTILRMVSLAIPVMDYIWHTGQLGAGYALRIRVAKTFNDYFQREQNRLRSHCL